MRRLAAGLTLSTGLIAPLCAHADDFISPGLLMSFRDAPTDEERLGVGAEVSSSHWRGELFDGGLGWGGLLQCEFWLDGSVRIALGGQVHAPGLGTEVAWSLRHDDAGLHNGLQVGLFVGIGYANMAGRAIVEAQGLDYSGAMTVKLPYRLDGGGFYGPDDFFGDNITSGRPHRVAADRVWRPRVAVLGRRGRRPPCATHRALGEAWLGDAVDEQAAVVAFWRLARDLQALGAPAGLLAACLRAAAEEARHARGCFAVAGHLLGLRLAPVAERLPVDAPLDAPMLAAMNLRDGRFNEGVAARQADRAASAAMVPAVRALLSAIAGEEAAHARLADCIEAWLVQAFGAPVRAAAAEARVALPDQAPTLRTVAAPTALARAFGRLDAAGQRAAFADAQRSMGGSRCAG